MKWHWSDGVLFSIPKIKSIGMDGGLTFEVLQGFAARGGTVVHVGRWRQFLLAGAVRPRQPIDVRLEAQVDFSIRIILFVDRDVDGDLDVRIARVAGHVALVRSLVVVVVVVRLVMLPLARPASDVADTTPVVAVVVVVVTVHSQFQRERVAAAQRRVLIVAQRRGVSTLRGEPRAERHALLLAVAVVVFVAVALRLGGKVIEVRWAGTAWLGTRQSLAGTSRWSIDHCHLLFHGWKFSQCLFAHAVIINQLRNRIRELENRFSHEFKERRRLY